MANRRVRTYLMLRLAAALVFLGAALFAHEGMLAALLVILAGVTAVMASVGANAGARGERAGARMQDRYCNGLTAPQGDWPPYQRPPVEVEPHRSS